MQKEQPSKKQHIIVDAFKGVYAGDDSMPEETIFSKENWCKEMNEEMQRVCTILQDDNATDDDKEQACSSWQLTTLEYTRHFDPDFVFILVDRRNKAKATVQFQVKK